MTASNGEPLGDVIAEFLNLITDSKAPVIMMFSIADARTGQIMTAGSTAPIEADMLFEPEAPAMIAEIGGQLAQLALEGLLGHETGVFAVSDDTGEETKLADG